MTHHLIELAVFQSAVHSIAEEMGAALRRTAISPNIKERRDYSCAVFNDRAEVIAMGDHMPVHLGSMPMSVRAVVRSIPLGPGDIAILNDPYFGGTHLPDITMVMPVYHHGVEKITFYVATRAHHSDVGGMYPGSMGPARDIFQEGIRIPPIHIVRAGKIQIQILDLILLNVRTPGERAGDIAAQIGACRVGEQRLIQLTERHNRRTFQRRCRDLIEYSDELVCAELRKLPAGEFTAEDFLDNDGVTDTPLRIAVKLTIEPVNASLVADFSGTSPQCAGSINAVRAVTLSACFYFLRCLLGQDAPATAGILRSFKLITQPGTLVAARPPAAVAGGNVDTSQRIVHTLLRALAQTAPNRVPAASAGTMSNLTIGGTDPRTNQPFTYYETTAGGMGATAQQHGVSGVQTHMTNSLTPPIEALEFAYPFRVRRYSYRPNSGGAGLHNGGNGLIREVELLTDAEVTLLADRRTFAPYGLIGGEPGATGRALANETELPGKSSSRLPQGTILRIETPGGGGWGSPSS